VVCALWDQQIDGVHLAAGLVAGLLNEQQQQCFPLARFDATSCTLPLLILQNGTVLYACVAAVLLL